MLAAVKDYLRQKRRYWSLPAHAKEAMRRDRRGLTSAAVDSEQVIHACLDWLGRAQDCSASRDGGFARDFSLLAGWATSYPETTGYIIPTLIDCAVEFRSEGLNDRARRALDWLVSIQLPSGGFQGGRIDSTPVVPVTFNTGQILMGLARGELAFGRYREPMQRAADWLVATLDDDGCWRKHATPFAKPGEKAYETHVSWGLFEAARVDSARGYAEAAESNVNWALRWQRENGWFDKCCLDDAAQPLTHTIGYVVRGVLEAFRFTGQTRYLDAAKLASAGVLGAMRADGFLPGRLRADWSPSVDWACLTGTAQNAHCWMMIYEVTGERRYLDAAIAANGYVARTVSLDGDPDIRGGVKGAFPIDGDYGPFEYLNWAPKFLIDSLMLQRRLSAKAAAA
jgi:hypothetical protein